MCVVKWLPTFTLGVLSTRSQCSVKATGAIVNLNGVGAEDVTGEVAGTMNMILY